MTGLALITPQIIARRRRISIAVSLVLMLGIELALGTGVLSKQPYLLALPLIPVVLLVIASRLDAGIIIMLGLMTFIRLGVSTGTASKLPFSLLFVALWFGLWLVKMALERNIRFVPSRVNLPVMAFITVVLISLAWSKFLIDPQIVISDGFAKVQFGTIGVTVASLLVVTLCLNLVRKVWLVKSCYWLIVGGSLFYLPFYINETFISAGQAAQAGPNEINFFTLSRLVNAGGLFPLWFCSLSLALLLEKKSLSKTQRIWVGIAFAGWLFRLFVITIVRISGWLPALVAMMIVVFIRSRKWFLILTTLAAIVIAFNYNLVYQSIVASKEQEGTLSGDTSRTSLWAQALQVSQDHLVLGTGPAGYANYYMTYFRDKALSTHNNYLDMLLQYGLIGLFTFLWVCFAMIKELWRAYRLQTPGTFEKAFCLGAFAGACGMMPGMWLGDWVIPFAYNQTITGFDYTGYNWVFIGLALALGRIKEENPEPELVSSSGSEQAFV